VFSVSPLWARVWGTSVRSELLSNRQTLSHNATKELVSATNRDSTDAPIVNIHGDRRKEGLSMTDDPSNPNPTQKAEYWQPSNNNFSKEDPARKDQYEGDDDETQDDLRLVS
jgi:hypothetical protein